MQALMDQYRNLQPVCVNKQTNKQMRGYGGRGGTRSVTFNGNLCSPGRR